MKRLRRLGRRWPWLGRLLDVQERVSEVNGGFVAAGITISAFLALFPLLLVAIAVIGFIAAGDKTVPTRLIDHLGLTGSSAHTMRQAIDHAAASRKAASVVGLLGLAWSGSGVAVALQQGVRAPWQERPEGLKDRVTGVLFLVAGAIGFAAVIALGGLLAHLPHAIPTVVGAAAIVVVGVAAEIGLFLWMFWALGDRSIPWRDLVPGAISAGVGFEVLKLVGTVYVPRLVAQSSSLYGPLGIVFAILAWLALFARLIVYCSAANAVRYEAREGTITLEVQAPKLPGRAPTSATRAGTIVTTK